MADFINTIDVLGDDAVIDSIINRTITEFNDNSITKVGIQVFYKCKALRSVSLPAATAIGYRAFMDCSALETLSIPALVNPDGGIFDGCSALKNVYAPVLSTATTNLFRRCSGLERLDLPALTAIQNYSLCDNPSLTALILRNTAEVVKLDSKYALYTVHVMNQFTANGNGYIYVPKALVDSYKAATNWSEFADHIRAIEDYPEITGG